jgi:hypothetical protein
MRRELLALSLLPAFLLAACQEHGTGERLRAAARVLGAEYRLSPDTMTYSFESREANTLVAVQKLGRKMRFEVQEPAYCQFRYTTDAGTSDATTYSADLTKLNRLEVSPTMSGRSLIVSLAGDTEAVSSRSRYGTNQGTQLRLNNLDPSQVQAFLSEVADFQDKMCGVKIRIPGS